MMTKTEKRLLKKCKKLEDDLKVANAVNDVLLKSIECVCRTKLTMDEINKRLQEASQEE